MAFIIEAFFSGCISKVINDGKDYSWSKIKSVIKDRHDQNISTKICRVIEKSLNIVTHNAYKNSDDLYDAIEKIFSEFKNHGDTLESVKYGLNILGADTSDQRCKNLLENIYEGIRQDDDLYKAVIMDLEQKGIKISLEEFQKLNEKVDRNHAEIVEKLDIINESGNEEKIDARKLLFQNNKKQDYINLWNSRLFLHTDKNPLTLAETFVMPSCRVLKSNRYLCLFDGDALGKIVDRFVKYDKSSTMLIMGVPGIGKSSMVSWIANKYRYDDTCIILRFRDWDSEELEKGILKSVYNTLECTKKDLDNKVIILDGYDEMKSLGIQNKLLVTFFSDIKDLLES